MEHDQWHPAQPFQRHDVRVTKATANVGVIIQCYECPERDSEAEYEWHDTDGTVYFTGTTIEDLIRFILVHPYRETKPLTVGFLFTRD